MCDAGQRVNMLQVKPGHLVTLIVSQEINFNNRIRTLIPHVLALELPSTGAVLLWTLPLHVPGQELHQVIGGTETALMLDWLGVAHREEQGC